MIYWGAATDGASTWSKHEGVLVSGGEVDRTSAHLGEVGARSDRNERYASFFTHHPHATYSVDARGYYTDANPRALEMTGLSLEQMKQVHFAAVIHPDDLPLIQAGFDAAMRGSTQVAEARVVHADGEIIHIRCTAIPLIEGGAVVGVHGVTEDITAAKQLVRELEEANRAKSLFLATVSHEVRTPLAALVGATDLLMHTPLTPEPAHYAEIVHRSSERLMRLVQDILEFSGLEAQQTVLHPRPFDVQELVDDVAHWANFLASSRGLSIDFDVDELPAPRLVGDCRRISQVLTNLVHNAIKFTEHGRVDVRISGRNVDGPTRADEPGALWVEFTVSDTGSGIGVEHQRTVFEPFTQEDPHLSGDRQGVGLGLAISRELVGLMGGRLTFTSQPGEGSTFTFGLPLVAVDESASASADG